MIAKENNKAAEEAQIRIQMDRFARAFRTRDIALMMSLFAPGMVSYDIIPPLQYKGSDIYTEVWKETFAVFHGAIEIEIRELEVTVGDDIAFSRNLMRLQSSLKDGKQIEFWERMTCGFQKIGGNWLIVHEHVSLPVDLKTGKAAMDLKP